MKEYLQPYFAKLPVHKFLEHKTRVRTDDVAWSTNVSCIVDANDVFYEQLRHVFCSHSVWQNEIDVLVY